VTAGIAASEPLRILALAGSLRAASLNRCLLDVAQQLAPPRLRLERFDWLDEVPLYNGDLDGEPPVPGVRTLREAIRAADGLLIASPEYNHSIPGVVKNAIDWASRPLSTAALRGKVVAVCVATTGRHTGYRALAEVSRVLRDIGCHVVASPEVVVSEAHRKLSRTSQGAAVLDDPYANERLAIQLSLLERSIDERAGELAAAGIDEQLSLRRPRTVAQP